MEFAVNRYKVNFHAIPSDPPPLPGARLEARPFGWPPFEMREIWIMEIDGLEELLRTIRAMDTDFEVSLSAYWSGPRIGAPGHCLFGISLVDDPKFAIDPRDRPVEIVRPSDKPDEPSSK